jgi:hypothetical protein
MTKLDYERKPTKPLWNHIVLAIVGTVVALPLLVFGGVGWYQQVYGEADVGGPIVWLIIIFGACIGYLTVKQWRIVWKRAREI